MRWTEDISALEVRLANSLILTVEKIDRQYKVMHTAA